MNAKHLLLVLFSISATIAITSCHSRDADKKGEVTDTLSEEQSHLSENALKGLVVADGLKVQKMAAEPAIKNPTNIDVDDRGRIYVTEAYNYRPEINGNPSNPAGDRIMILEDKDGDGMLKQVKFFIRGQRSTPRLAFACWATGSLFHKVRMYGLSMMTTEMTRPTEKKSFFKASAAYSTIMECMHSAPEPMENCILISATPEKR